MAGGTKPDTRLVIKSKATGKTVLTLASYWTEGRDMPSGGLDRSIERVAVEWRDREGNLHKEVIDNRKDQVTHYCNLQVWKTDAPAQQRSAPARSKAPELPPDDLGVGDDDGDSSIPF